MTQHIFVIGSDRQWEEDQILAAAQEMSIDADFLEASKLHIALNAQDADVYHSGESIRNALKQSRIVFRRTRGSQDMMIALTLLADHWNIPHTDSVHSILGNVNKMHFMPSLTLKRIENIPTHFLCSHTENVPSLILDFSPPYILKPVSGRHGEGIVVAQSADEVEKHSAESENDFLLQKFLEIDEEYRVFVVGGEALGCIRKVPEEGSKVANYAAGASFHNTDLPDDITQEAVALCAQQGIDIGGVDLARIGETYYLLELNRCPEFKAFYGATGIEVALHIVDFLLSK